MGTEKIKRKASKRNIKGIHQKTKEETKKTGTKKNEKDNQKTVSKMAVSRYLSIITLNVNGLTPPIERE